MYPTNRANADTIQLTVAELRRFGTLGIGTISQPKMCIMMRKQIDADQHLHSCLIRGSRLAIKFFAERIMWSKKRADVIGSESGQVLP